MRSRNNWLRVTVHSATFLVLLCGTLILSTEAYEVSWSVDNPENGNQFGHEETRTADETSGRYYVLLPDGRMQTVVYRVDKYSGFVVDISYEYVGFPTTSQDNLGTTPYLIPSSLPSDVTTKSPEIPETLVIDNFVPPEYPTSEDDNTINFSPPIFSDVPDTQPADFSPPDYSDSSLDRIFSDGDGGLFAGEEEVNLVPDPQISSFFPGNNKPNSFGGIGISFPGNVPGTGNNPIIFPPTLSNNNNEITFPEVPKPQPIPIKPNTSDLGVLLSIFQNGNLGSSSSGASNSADSSPSGFDPDFPVPPDFIPIITNNLDPTG